MKTKRIYNKPQIEEIHLDNEISLQLASVVQGSTPPGDPSAVKGSDRMNSESDSDPYQYDTW